MGRGWWGWGWVGGKSLAVNTDHMHSVWKPGRRFYGHRNTGETKSMAWIDNSPDHVLVDNSCVGNSSESVQFHAAGAATRDVMEKF